jgi:hypothetical protein
MTAPPPRSKQPPAPACVPWEEGGFRETLLRRFPESERQTLRDLGKMLEEYAGELGRYSANSDRSAVRELLLAVAADLRHSRGWLEVLARQREESTLAAAERPLCQAAAQEVAEIDRIAGLFEAAVDESRGQP